MMTLLRLKKNLFFGKKDSGIMNKRTLLQVKKKELKTIITSQEERAQNYIRTKHKINTSTVNNQENW